MKTKIKRMCNELVCDAQRKYYRAGMTCASQCPNSKHNLFRTANLKQRKKKALWIATSGIIGMFTPIFFYKMIFTIDFQHEI